LEDKILKTECDGYLVQSKVTDTTGAVTSGVAGLYYGYKNIPIRWIEEIARKEDIEVLA
jgi:hypothetical protein